MKKRGYTLIEVLLAIFLLGLISVSFLPVISSGYKNIISSQKFTEELFEEQKSMENQIENLREITPGPGSVSTKIYGKTIKSHEIKVSTSSGQLRAYIPKRTINPQIPVIQAPPVINIRKGNINVSPQSSFINLLDNEHSLFVSEINITNSTKDSYLMSIYRWYISELMSDTTNPGDSLSNYFIIKEWNEAKKQIPFENSLQLKYIPNIKDNYNTFNFLEVKDGLNFNQETLINTLGNRYIRYGVTPFAISGHIGEEELSDPIYIVAPKIEIESAWLNEYNEILIYFKDNIENNIDLNKINLNEELGVPQAGRRDENNHKLLILTLYDIDNTRDYEGNTLYSGAIVSNTYGRISIWHNSIPEGEFTIHKHNP